MVVEGLDINALSSITRGDDCAWSAQPVELDGTIDGGILRVDAAQAD